MPLKKREPSSNGDVAWEVFCVEEFVFSFPAVVEFLTRTTWEPKVPRLTGTVLLMADQGHLKLWAHDRDSKESLFLSGISWEELFRALEGHLRDGTGEWRKDRGGQQNFGKKGS